MAFHPLNARPLAFTLNQVAFRAVTKAIQLSVNTIRHVIVTLHLRDHCGAASLCYKNRAQITVPIGEQKSYPVWFSCLRKSNPVGCKN